MSDLPLKSSHAVKLIVKLVEHKTFFDLLQDK